VPEDSADSVRTVMCVPAGIVAALMETANAMTDEMADNDLSFMNALS
jgi:hypothetical protein